MDIVRPTTAAELAEALGKLAADGAAIRLGGNFTKDRMGGWMNPGATAVSTQALNRVLQYEPNDLTVSVEAGLPYRELKKILAENNQMAPLDPPLAEEATIGGVVAANCSGPRRRLYGTARDMVIGMQFATVGGKLVNAGGMVVKNVAGLDMAKLMIGSFGTLAAIAVVNFKLMPMPEGSTTFLHVFDSLEAAEAQRQALLRGVLQPMAIDLLNPAAARCAGRDGYLLAVQAGGTPAVLARYRRELTAAEVLAEEAEKAFWRGIGEFAAAWAREHAAGAVVRVSCPTGKLPEVFRRGEGPLLARAGNGVCYACFEAAPAAVRWLRDIEAEGYRGVVEWGPESGVTAEEQWPDPGQDLTVMQRIKELFDPRRQLNRGRLYGRI